MDTPRVRLGELLVKSGLISERQLEETLALQKEDGRRLGTLLVESGLVSETQVTQILSQQLSVPWVSLLHIDFSRQLLDLVPKALVEKYCLVPIYVRRVRGLGQTLYVAMDDPTNAHALQDVAHYAGMHVRAMIAPPSDIFAAIRAYYGIGDGSPEVSEQKDEEEVLSSHRRAELVSEPNAAVPNQPRPVQESAVQVRTGEAPGEAEAPEVGEPELSAAPSPMGPGPSRSGPGGGRRQLISLTLLDGTTIELPAPSRVRSGEKPDQLTGHDLVAALRAAAHGADASEVLGDDVRWEALFAALLSLLLKKHLITDWEFVEEYKKG